MYDKEARKKALQRAIKITDMVNPLLAGQNPAIFQKPRPPEAVWGEPFYYLERRCHRIVFEALQPFIPLKIDRIMDVTEGIGAGFSGMGEICGTVSGAIMAAGLDLASRYDDQNLIRILVSKYTQKLMRGIKQELGSYYCRDITGYDMSGWLEEGTKGGWSDFVHDEAAVMRCGKMMEFCIMFPLPSEEDDYLI